DPSNSDGGLQRLRDQADDNTRNNAQPIGVREFNARLLFVHDVDAEQRAGLECIPLARFRLAPDGAELAPAYAPPALRLFLSRDSAPESAPAKTTAATRAKTARTTASEAAGVVQALDPLNQMVRGMSG